MEKLNKILEEIKEHQMQTVQFARTTKIYKLAEKAQQQTLIIDGVSSRRELLFSELINTIEVFTRKGSFIRKSNSYNKIKRNL